jgi:hypothetical protein
MSQPDFPSAPQQVVVPWGAWHGDADHALDVPAAWTIHYLWPHGGDALTIAQVGERLDDPIGAPSLQELARGARSTAIAVDDQTRPTPAGDILPLLVERLEAGGIRRDRITIVMAIGAHRAPTALELEAKLQPARLAGVKVVVHDPAGDLVDTGVALGGVPVKLSRPFMDADLRLSVGCVMPHPFAAFSGGGKMLIPGLAALDVVARTHTFALMGLGGGNDLATNRFRRDMERAVREIGLHWTVNVAVTGKRHVAAVCAGDLVEAHRAACAAVARSGATLPPPLPLDALIINAYPKDTELLQIEAALVPLRQGVMQWLRPDAPIVLTAPCPQGLGRHLLFEPGGTVYRKPARKTFYGQHPFIVHTPGATDEEVRTLFWEGYPALRQWPDVVAALEPLMPLDARVGVLPSGPMQVPAGALPIVGGDPERRDDGTVVGGLSAAQI